MARVSKTTAGLLLLAAFLVVRAFALVLVQRVPLAYLLGSGLYLTLGALVLGGLFIARAAQSLKNGGGPSGACALRWAFTCGVATWMLFLTFVQPFQRLWFDLAIGLMSAAFGASLVVDSWLARRSEGAQRVLQLTAFSLCAGLLGLELGLRTWAGVRPSPLLARVGGGPGDLVERFRCEPGEVRFGFACNSAGFYDEEFFLQESSDPREHIVVIGDSFSVGAVPQPWHYTSVCEDLLDARLDSMGVAGIGPPEYLSLLVDEALPLNPDRIVIAIFLGNDLDIEDALDDLPDSFLRAWLQRDQVLLFVLPERISRIKTERSRVGAREVPGEDVHDRSEALEIYPWLEDPSLEEPPLSEQTFLSLETKRALALCAQTPPSLERCYESLLAARRAAGDVPLLVLLIPDEFQIEDRLWDRVTERAGRPLERTRAQELLLTWLEANGIESLDLLPILRGVMPLEDGDRHLYHARDTHFNARGNKVVGQALADYLRSL